MSKISAKIGWSSKFRQPDTDEIVSIDDVYNVFVSEVLDDDFKESYQEYAEKNGYTLFDVYLLQEVSATNLIEM